MYAIIHIQFRTFGEKDFMNVKKQFAKYVSQNILGMIGLSCYILADSFFIAKAEGANGLTALNLVLPLYNLIFAIGSMIGVGSAIRYTISRSKEDSNGEKYLFNAIFFATVFGIIFSLIGFFLSDKILMVLGADQTILETGNVYTKIFMAFSPVFMWNYIANAYVRNDGAPTVAMVATLCSSLFNIVFDYILMFPLQMGMAGAALATAFSPIVGICICMVHFLSKKSSIKIKFCIPSFKRLFRACQVGVSAFVGEISSGVITLVFNFLILGITGNVGVAAFGVIANISLVAVSVFNGIALGSQPLISKSFGKGNKADVKLLRNMAFITSLIAATILYCGLFIGAKDIVNIFNSEQNIMLAQYAEIGVKLYFIGIFFAGLNIVGSSFFSATENVKGAFWISILRGFVFIIISAVVLSMLFKMNGIWIAYGVGEFATSIVMVYFLRKELKN